MSRSYHTARWAGLVVVIVFVAAVAFGAKLWQKPPADFVLPPAVDDASDTSALEPRPAEPDITRTRGAFGGAVATTRTGDPLMGNSSRSADTASPVRTRQTAPISRWTPWGTESWRRNVSGSTFSSGSASLGGLWHTMSPFGHGGTTADTAVVARADSGVKLTSKPQPAKPAPKPAPKPSPAPSAGSTAPSNNSSSGAAAGGESNPAAPGSGLGEDETPPSDPGDPAPGGGGLGGGSGSGGGSSSGGDLSANPEPGTIALFGTGLIGLIQVLRRRRS